MKISYKNLDPQNLYLIILFANVESIYRTRRKLFVYLQQQIG